jgi:ATP-dependent RNA helicase DDX5/DBP2
VAIAKTGSGKTCGFLLPGFVHVHNNRLDPRHGPSMLVLAPTRELAVQIKEEADKFGRSAGVRNTCAPSHALATLRPQFLLGSVHSGSMCISSSQLCRCTYGGAPKGPQLRDIQYGVHLIIATPGRLNDFLEGGQVRLSQVCCIACSLFRMTCTGLMIGHIALWMLGAWGSADV